MHSWFGYAGTAASLLLAQASLAEPVNLSNPTDRDIGIEIVSNSCPDVDPECEAPGIYASDPAAEFTSLGEAPIAFVGGTATITIPASVWAEVLIALLGEAIDPMTEPGIVRNTVTDHLLSIDTLTGGPADPRSWEATLIVEDSTFGFLPVELTFRATDTTRAGDFGASPGTDYFFYDAEGTAISCVEHSPSVEPPGTGECLAADFRGDESYDPQTGTFTFLGVTTNQYVPTFASPTYSLTNFRITEVPEPRAVLAQLAALAAVLLLGGFASRRS